MRVWNNTKGLNNYSGYFNDIIHDRLYFGTVGGGSSVIQARDYRIFVNGVGQQSKNISTGALVTQSDAETSLEGQGGTIPNGESFVIVAVGIDVRLANVQATTPFTDDTVNSINVTPVVRVSPIPLHDALLSQCTFELYRNSDQRLENGVVNEYPTEFGVQGFAGGSGATVPALAGGAQNSYVINPTVQVQSAGMRFRALTVYQTLKALDQFYGVFKVNREIDLAATALTGWIDFYLVGQLMTDYEADQFVATFDGRAR